MSDLERMIYLYNDSEPITAIWDGKEYELGKEPVEIEQGVATHWQDRYPDAKLRIEDVPQAVIQQRIPVNPLEVADRGEAFAAIKRPRKKASGE